MELYQLRTFVVVAEERNLSRAAKRLFTTPPAISAQIKALEEELGVALFLRTPRGMTLTEKGALLRPKAVAALAAAQNVVNHATELREELIGTVSLGLNAPVGALRIPQVLDRLRASARGIELDLVQSNSGEIIERLNAGDLDMGFVFGDLRTRSLTAHALGSLRLVVAIPKRWTKDLEHAQLPRLAQFPWIYSNKYCPFQTMTDELLERHGLECERITATNDEGAKQALVTAGVGIALLLEDEAYEAAERGALAFWRGEPLSAHLSLACRSDRHEEPLLRAVRLRVLDAWERAGEEAA